MSKAASQGEVSALEIASEAAAPAGCRSASINNDREAALGEGSPANQTNSNPAPLTDLANVREARSGGESDVGSLGSGINSNGHAGDFQASAIGTATPRVAASSTEQQNNIAASPVRLSNHTISEADDWFISVDPFFNSANPCYVLKRERPEHRVIVYLKAQGFSYVEIAERVGWSAPGVANVCKQKWAQDLLLKEITKAGRNRVEHILSGEALNSVLKLVTLRDDDDAPKEVQRKAANDLLDRVYGKPTLPLQHTHIDPKKVSDEELARIAQQGKVN